MGNWTVRNNSFHTQLKGENVYHFEIFITGQDKSDEFLDALVETSYCRTYDYLFLGVHFKLSFLMV